MGLIHIELFATLDLVGQSPGGWQAPCWTRSEGHRVPALRARRWHARDGGHGRTRSRCRARRLKPPAPGGSVSPAVNPILLTQVLTAQMIRRSSHEPGPCPTRAVTDGDSRSFTGQPGWLLTCAAAGPPVVTTT
jgi:hypothetical protein